MKQYEKSLIYHLLLILIIMASFLLVDFLKIKEYY